MWLSICASIILQSDRPVHCKDWSDANTHDICPHNTLHFSITEEKG